jgi:hypothetical protein
MNKLRTSFQTVIHYIETDNDGDMNQQVRDLLEVLKDLQEKADHEEIDRYGNVTVHCEDCDSPNLIMLNANCTWNVEEQRWEYSENYDPFFQCAECGTDSINLVEKENSNA